MNTLEQLKRIKDALMKKTQFELVDMARRITPEQAARFAELERWIMGKEPLKVPYTDEQFLEDVGFNRQPPERGK